MLICLGRHEEMDNMIEALVKDAAVPRYCIATRAGKGYFNADAQAPSIDQAQILVATQQGLAKLAKYKSFSETTAFHYRGKPRTIRVWDESFQQGDPLALDRDDIVSLAKLFRYGPLKPLEDRLEQLFIDLKDAQVDTPFPMPDFEGDFDMPIEALLGNLKTNLGETRSRHLEALWTMSGRLVGLHKDSSGGTAVDYEETAPAELAPMLVCDVSGRVRESYKSMEKDRGNWVRLPHGGKLYDNLTIHHWNKGGGKASFLIKPTPSPTARC